MNNVTSFKKIVSVIAEEFGIKEYKLTIGKPTDVSISDVITCVRETMRDHTSYTCVFGGITWELEHGANVITMTNQNTDRGIRIKWYRIVNDEYDDIAFMPVVDGSYLEKYKKIVLSETILEHDLCPLLVSNDINAIVSFVKQWKFTKMEESNE